ncbi:TetR/AcrR family transcriptional regulator [Streptomyces sp. MBT65]|uniref:TetR/AcrR family transcriptional regulator n=1 Tax=Streptomyces sp. MBT65 TaxID=1488395 RepID=UPI00190DAEBA|nr:TetR/AcrR family transcriptional regulator [Streptomyces sp. MBT65]MBK3574954.1 TetR/AcrR family transcriptional regulator [Streptomyces sp. MBT65]
MQSHRSTHSAQDRRVQRSRSVLLAAAVRLVVERETTDIAVTDITDAADVSRKLLYLHYTDRDGLLVAAAADLVERELFPRVDESPDDLRAQVLVLASHFAERRVFYRAMLTGSCAFAMTRTLNDLFGSLNQAFVRDLYAGLDKQTVDDLAAFFTGGASLLLNEWLVDGADPLRPQDLADRLLRVASVLAPAASPAPQGDRLP